MTDLTYQELRKGPALMTPEEFAQLVRVTPRTVNNWIRTGEIEAIRLSDRVYRIPRAAVVKKFFPDRIQHRPIRTGGRVPKPGRGERLRAHAKRRTPVTA